MRTVVPLRTTEEFSALTKSADGLATQRHLRLLWLRNPRQENRLGIRVSAERGRRLRATQRNRLRRQIREIYRHMQQDVPQGYDLLVIAKCTIPPPTFAQLQDDWQTACTKWQTRVALTC